MLRRRRLLTGLAAGGMLPSPGVSAPNDRDTSTLRIAWRDAPQRADFYSDNLRSGYVLSLHTMDGLIYRDPETFQLKPLLATRWRQVDDTTIDFELRKDVAFHNGDPLTADDVAYTVSTVVSLSGIAVPSNYEFLAGAEATSPTSVRIRLRRAYPAALDYIAMVLPILPRLYRTEIGAEAFGRAPVGTGPYRVTRVDPMNAIILDRFDSYPANSPKGRPSIGHLSFNVALDERAAVSALTTGLVDWTWDFGQNELDGIIRNPRLQALRAETMRVTYLSLDASGRTGEGTPLTNADVRRAIDYAIDRTTIANTIAGTGSRPIFTPCFPSQFGCVESAAVRRAYAPDRARALLAQAGFPSGFTTDLVSDQLPSLIAAIQRDLSAIGITTRINAVRTADAIATAAAGRAPLFLSSWGSYAINDAAAFLPPFFTGGPLDYTRDSVVSQLVDQAVTATDPDRRRQEFADAIHRITQNADWLPIASTVRTYAFDRSLDFRTFADDLPRFYLARWR